MNLAQLMMAASHDDDDSDGPALTHEQQITRLTEYFAQVYAPEPERFEPGQIIWHKVPKMADTKRADHPVCFVGYLDGPVSCLSFVSDVREIGSNIATKVYDATMVTIDGDGDANRHFIDTRFYTATKPRSTAD